MVRALAAQVPVQVHLDLLPGCGHFEVIDPLSAVWLLIGFIGLQQLEGHVVSPQVFGHALRINPIVIIISLLIGDALYGIVGSLIAGWNPDDSDEPILKKKARGTKK